MQRYNAHVCVCVCKSLFRFPLYFAAAGLVLNWNQTNGVLHASGDVRVIRLWDTHKEMKILVRLCYKLLCLKYRKHMQWSLYN